MNKNNVSIIPQTDIIDVSKIPPERLNCLAKAALDAMRTAYSDPEFVKGFERWEKQQVQKGVKNG